ncbi:MAG TPA: HRDC domain-containing protein [Bacteroidia bacterium]|nr:HRDC domain-containing protein [Bacteroidia bacterium]HNU32905.1 HRDC domain-containing protein [Bacteroidia bacterium]
MQTNPQLQLAFDFVQYTNKNVFLTGKAGTGKTTFLRNLKSQTPKRMAIVAPTGVAAINAGGVTIHSFFQLPFGPYVPGSSNNNAGFNKKFRGDKIKLLRSLDLLVIDEISMVRADVLDGIDDVLRRYRNRHLPFGGLQLLMIGDLHQLSPIVKDDEMSLLRPYYDTFYFFGSRALQQSAPVTIELKEIFRQTDGYFIKLLNKVRNNQLDHHDYLELNERYQPSFIPDADDGYITLTTHNYSAQNINQNKLNRLDDELHTFKATIKGEFPEFAYPTEFELQLKVNAQVMFVKNDPSREKLFYNGKIGRITAIDDDEITVKCKDDNFSITVKPLEWQNLRYSLGDDKQVKEEVAGSFTQFPLKLAWAITIHKSQGLTFERAIIDAQASFAHGQVYVALSRCKTFEGMILRSPINEASIKTDEKISHYTQQIEDNLPGTEYLLEEKKNFQIGLMNELFNFSGLQNRLLYAQKNIGENISAIDKTLFDNITQIIAVFDTDVFSVNQKFTSQFNQLMSLPPLPEENEALQERVKKAAGYFFEKVSGIYNQIKALTVDTDNAAIRKQLTESLQQLQLTVFEKKYVLQKAQAGFNAIAHIQAKANAEIDFEREAKSFSPSRQSAVSSSSGNKLKTLLRQWRDAKAAELDTDVYMVISRKALDELSEKMPATLKELLLIKGIGKRKVAQFGDEILSIINSYCNNNNIPRDTFYIEDELEDEPETKKLKEKGSTLKLTLELFNAGKTINEIAKERNLAASTIEGHLALLIKAGDADIFKILNDLKVDEIQSYFEKNTKATINDAKLFFGNKTSFAELRMVLNYMEFKKI